MLPIGMKLTLGGNTTINMITESSFIYQKCFDWPDPVCDTYAVTVTVVGVVSRSMCRTHAVRDYKVRFDSQKRRAARC